MMVVNIINISLKGENLLKLEKYFIDDDVDILLISIIYYKSKTLVIDGIGKLINTQ